MYLILFVAIIVVIGYAFNRGDERDRLRAPVLRWFGEALRDVTSTSAVERSARIALLASLVPTRIHVLLRRRRRLAVHLGAGNRTWPLRILSALRFGLKPDINATATMMLTVTILGLVAAALLLGVTSRRRLDAQP